MRILVIGSGGREHALSWKIAESASCEKLYCAPGNGGISEVAQLVNISADDIPALLNFAKNEKIGLTVVGPEAPLVNGIVDEFQRAGLKIFGPKKELAALEGSKVFAKTLMKRLGVPTAGFEVFERAEKALEHVEARQPPLVVKADGLAAGKGVIICKTIDEAKAAVKSMMVDKVFGDAGAKIIVEDCLYGEEASIIVVSDGNTIVPLASSQDHKRIFDGDRGPNTGGMGAYSPAPVVTEPIFKKILESVISPIIKEFETRGKPYKGCLYAGIMLTEEGPKVLEFNVRFGDPETQAMLPRLKGDLVDLMEKAIDGKLKGCALEWDERPCVSVVMASGGYPASYEKGMEIKGIEEAMAFKDTYVFHAGTRLGLRAHNGDGLYLTDGGRVLNVTALGRDIPDAINNCYRAVAKIEFSRMHYRKDIGHRAIK